MSQNKPQWRVRTPRAGEAAGVEVYDGAQYVCQMSHHPAQRAQAAEYARRLVACVNACDGVPTELLETSTDALGALTHQQNLRKRAEAQRDELLAALEDLFAECDTGERRSDGRVINRLMPSYEGLCAAQAAIARVKGGAA